MTHTYQWPRLPVTHTGYPWPVQVTSDPCRLPMTRAGYPWPVQVTRDLCRLPVTRAGYPWPMQVTHTHYLYRFPISVTHTGSPYPYPVQVPHTCCLYRLPVPMTCIGYPYPWPIQLTHTCDLYNPYPWPIQVTHTCDLYSHQYPHWSLQCADSLCPRVSLPSYVATFYCIFQSEHILCIYISCVSYAYHTVCVTISTCPNFLCNLCFSLNMLSHLPPYLTSGHICITLTYYKIFPIKSLLCYWQVTIFLTLNFICSWSI
jgi:hypothetical protein